ncbi:hypothetical protein IFM89_015909 [Coptis chinensis]|uniref:Serine/threonine-protein phosphatase n=1 Tax=Coptis chinensis TaxID=261450 RepID=A0A835HXT7_9MAGN|nr:hypothetical protein IFM89_015909 [Coptis chinensis]
MGSKPWLYPAPTYHSVETTWETNEDAPGPRCSHSLTAVAANKSHGPRLILFGGATAIEGGAFNSHAGIRLAGVTNSVHCYDVLTRKWTRVIPAGDPPSPRAAHAAAAVGTMVVFQGGIGPAGHSTDDLYVLDMTNEKFKWHRLVVQDPGPGPRYGHVMDLVAQRYLVTVSGNDVFYLNMTKKKKETQDDVTWKHCTKVGDGKKAKLKCNYCGKEYSGGVFRIKHYLVCTHENVVACAKVEGGVKEFFFKLLEENKMKKQLLGDKYDGGDEEGGVELVGKRVLPDAWALDTAQKPYRWQKLSPEGDRPCARMYATASARSDGMFLLCGGRDISGTPLADAYGLLMHRNGQWEWTLAPGVSPSPRYQHAAVFVGARLHVTGGTLKGGRAIEGEPAIAVLDTAAGVWLDRNGIVTSSRTSKVPTDTDGSLELMRRGRHASASVGVRIYIYGGLRGDTLLDDLLVAENSPFQSEISSPIFNPERTPTMPSSKISQASSSSSTPPNLDEIPENTASDDISVEKKSIDTLVEASTAEAEAVSAAWQAAKAASTDFGEGTSVSDKRLAETSSDGNGSDADVRLHSRAVVVAKETVGNLGGLVRQLSLDQFENESRRMSPMNSDSTYSTKKFFTRQKSPQGLHKKIITALLRPRNWRPPVNRRFFLDSYEVGELCYAAEQIFMQEPTVLQLKAPVKIFGDLHGQFGDLMRLFDEYGFPSTAGDITYIDYLFLGDYVDRGQHSLETITLLLALKIEYPENVHLIRGNHEAADINALFGFRLECIERMGESDGIWAWTRFNQLFNFLPLAALIEKKIICMHGGIGRSINSVEQIEKLERPITMDAGSIILMDLLWSDPTENDSIEGLRPNARGPGLVTFGDDLVLQRHPAELCTFRGRFALMSLVDLGI